MRRFVIILGIVLLVAGVAGLVHPNFSYHKQEEVEDWTDQSHYG